MRYGLALSGGGARGAAHVGVLLALKENGLWPDSLAGNGIGLLNMKERVEALNGNFNLQTRGGFSIFISVPREGKK